jgi:hypothetical protein
MRLIVAFVACALLPRPAHAFVPPSVDYTCPRTALHGTWAAYAHTRDGVELNPRDRMRSTPGHLELLLTFSELGSKAIKSILYEVERAPTTCVARTMRYAVRDMTWDLELTSRDDVTIRVVSVARGTDVIRLYREAAPGP